MRPTKYFLYYTVNILINLYEIIIKFTMRKENKMTRLHKITSFILVLALLLSCTALTVGAVSTAAVKAGVDIDDSVELFTPNANYVELNDATAKAAFENLKSPEDTSTSFGVNHFTSAAADDDLKTYLVQSEDTDDYMMFVPTQATIKRGEMDYYLDSNGKKNTKNHLYVNANVNTLVTHSASAPTYYVWECDVATEQFVLPFYYQIVSRTASGGGNWSDAWHPANNPTSPYMTMEPGYFHHLTFIGDIYNNVMYVYIDNQLVIAHQKGVMSTDGNAAYKTGTQMKIEGVRMQIASGHKITEGMQLSVKNMYGAILTGSSSYDNLPSVLGSSDLSAWTKNRCTTSHKNDPLVPLVEVNGVEYTSATAASEALDTYKLGNEAYMLRPLLSGYITVNSDAVIHTYTTGADIRAGADVNLTKADGSTWVATLKHPKLSTSTISSNEGNITKHVKYEHANNLINNIMQSHSITENGVTVSDSAIFAGVKANTVNGDIIMTDNGNTYLNVYDASGAADDYGTYNGKAYEAHYQVNANVRIAVDGAGNISNVDEIGIKGHDFIVFDYDIYSESSFINVYNEIIIRNAQGNAPIDGAAPFMKDTGSTFSKAAIELTPGRWNHLTFIGDVNTGTLYVYVDNELKLTVVDSLYIAANRDTIGLENMCLGSFRALQISDYTAGGGRNPSGQYLDTEKACASDNYVLRFVDGSNYTIGQQSLNDWNANINTNDYTLPEIPLLATVNGVEKYDSTSLNNMLNVADDDFSLPEQNVVFYREFTGTVTINCRAIVNTNGISGVLYGPAVTTSTNGNIVNVYKQSPADLPETSNEVQDYSSFDSYQTTDISGNSIKPYWLSSKSGNLYNTHATSGSNTKIVQAYTGYSNGSAVYGNDFIMDVGAQTHTLQLDSSNNSINSSTSASGSGTHSTTSEGFIYYTYTTTINSTITVSSTQYYTVMEFDIAQIGGNSNSVNIKSTVKSGTTEDTYTIYNVAPDLANSGEYKHITIIGYVEAVFGDGDITTGDTNLNNDGTVSYSNFKTPTVNYSLTYKVFVDNEYKTTVTSISKSTTQISKWTNMIIDNGGNQIVVDNVYIGIASETLSSSYTTQTTGTGKGMGDKTSDAQKNAKTNFSNNGYNTLTAVERQSPSSTNNSNNTTLDSCFSTTGTLNDSNFGGTAASMPDATYDSSAKEPPIVTGSHIEVTPAVNYPIAYVYTTDGEGNTVATPYYEADAAALAEVLATANTEAVSVSFLRTPEVPFTLTTNAKIDTNGLNISDLITYDENNNDYHVITDGDSVEVVVIEKTVVIANLNGEDFKSLNLLQEALNLADEAELVFYVSMEADESITITCPANIVTNGCTVNYDVDEYAFDVTKTTEGGEVTEISIVKNNKTGMIKVNLSAGGNTYNVHTSEALAFGTDIEDYLHHHGVLSGTFVIDGTVWYDATWDVTPSGYVDSTDTVTYTATATKSSNADFVYVDASGTLHEMSKEEVAASDSDVIMSWFAESGDSTIVLNDDWNIKTVSGTVAAASSGVKNIYLNGNTIRATNNTADHTWVIGGTADYNFFGSGTIDMTKNISGSVFFANYNYTGTVTFSGITLNTSHVFINLRGGNAVVKNCEVNAFTNNSVPGLFILGEDNQDKENEYSTNPMSLTLVDSDITFRYSDIRNTYTDRKDSGKNIALFYHKIVDRGDNDPISTVVVDGCNIVAQGALLQANAYNSNVGAEDAYKRSNLKLYINDSTIIAKQLALGDLRRESIIFYDDIRTNITAVDGVSFNVELIKANTGDGLAEILYTSHDYATVTWSDGVTEFWAAGSLPVRATCPFDNTTFVNAGETKKLTKGSAVSFSFLANLTLANTIGFNLYIPTSEQITAVYMDGKLITAGDKITPVENAGNVDCYNYTLNLPAHEAGKTFSILIILKDGRQVTRTTSVGHYALSLKKANSDVNSNWLTTDAAVKAKALLSASLGYIEHATMYAGYNVNNMLKLSTVLAACGTSTRTPSGTVADTSALADYISGVQLNIADTVRFRFNLKTNSTVSFEVIDDAGRWGARDAIVGDGYVELSLRAYELNKDIRITIDGKSCTYNLYTYYNALQTLMNNAGDTGVKFEYNAALRFVQQLYTYAAITDEQFYYYNPTN